MGMTASMSGRRR